MSTGEERGTEVGPQEEMETRPEILRYDREELLRLEGALGHLQQDEWWEQHCKDLGPDVAKELRELQAVPDAIQQVSRRRSKNSERRQRSKAKREALHALSVNASGSDKDEHVEYENSVGGSLDPSLRRVGIENTCGRKHMGKGRFYDPYYIEDLPEVESFQPQAFAVEGEPDFESGPPEDGWEYLRRVKYEAVRCPKVVVAKIDATKLLSEQTPYMPEIPEIPACPSDLLPSKEWEKHFLEEFSYLRMALSNISVPPTFGADKLPSLRNKTAWEVRCFGSITSVQDEDCKDMDAVTTEEPIAEPRCEDSAIQTNNSSLSSVASARDENNCAENEARKDFVEDGEFIERLETQIESLSNIASACESSYVIDLGLITDYVPVNEPYEPYNESFYFINGEPAEAGDDNEAWKATGSSAGVCQPVDGSVSSAKSLELDQVEGSSFEIVTHFEHLSMGGPDEPHGDDERMKPLSFNPVLSYSERDNVTTADFPDPGGVRLHTVQAEVDTCIGINTSTAHLVTIDLENAEDGTQFTQSCFNLEIVENDHLASADFERSLDGDAWALDEAEFGEVYSGIDSQFDYLTIEDSDINQGEMEAKLSSFSGTELPDFEDAHLSTGDYPDVVKGEMEVELPSFSDTELPEFEDSHMPTADFVDSLIGLEIFRSGNVLGNEPQESLDATSHSIDFKIDGPLEELFNRVFQLFGVSQLPFIHLLLRLDEVSRAALFRHHVSWLENVNGLPKDRALWLLALSAVVDMPLDSQTSAAFRAMLRHCSGVRALKQSRDDEDLYLLNALIAVAGVYFGQAEAILP